MQDSSTLLPRSSDFRSRFHTTGTVSNPCLRTPCFFSPRYSLVAPPERLSPARPVDRLDSQYGRVSNDRVSRLPTPSTRQTHFHPFPGGSQHRSPLPLRDPGAGCTNTPHYTPHDFRFPHFFSLRFVFSCVKFSQSTHTYWQLGFLLSLLPKLPITRSLRYFAPLPTHSDLCLSADRCTGNSMHPYPHRTPQHTISPSLPPIHVTHGTRVSPNPRQ